MTTILVCGGRDYVNRVHLFQVLTKIATEWPGQITLIHGGASGADSLAGEWAKLRGIRTTIYPADWKRDGRSAGPIRNSEMLIDGKPDLVVAFPGGRGTADMVTKARRAGIPIR